MQVVVEVTHNISARALAHPIQYDGNINPDVVSIHAERSILSGAYFMANSDEIKQKI